MYHPSIYNVIAASSCDCPTALVGRLRLPFAQQLSLRIKVAAVVRKPLLRHRKIKFCELDTLIICGLIN